ncbi:zinc metallopeptidase [Olsenella urininfantis]|uniref:zinc metallopeptidase n=1 Tax=Olsenella urininfantis TaxID=1871033 RepID=UPI00190E9CB2|nr:zinc metallopeptidase [Olsenella urininfantis]
MPLYYGYGMDLAYLGIAVVSLLLGMLTQGFINSTYKRWSLVPASSGATGAQVARAMLDGSGASAVGITQVAGHLTDYYDPRDNRLHLSEENYEGGSVASVAVACHEAGHAVQTAKGYLPGRFRTALVPVVNFTQQTWMLVLVLGIMLNISGLTQLAVLLFGFSVLFQLVTLPVEIDASRRAVAYLRSSGAAVDERGARQVLTAAALTYVSAALVSVLQLAYIISRSGDRR